MSKGYRTIAVVSALLLALCALALPVLGADEAAEKASSGGEAAEEAATATDNGSASEDEKAEEDQTEEERTAIPRALGAVETDGVLSESAWKSSLAVELPFRLYKPVAEPDDFRVLSYLMWDDDYLYVAYEVTDNALIFEQEEDDYVWETDAVQVWIEKVRLGAAWDKQGEQLLQSTDYENWLAPDLSACSFALQKTDEGYRCELAVHRTLIEKAIDAPWAAGSEFRMALGAVDVDKEKGEVRFDPHWPARFAWNNPESFVPVVLAE